MLSIPHELCHAVSSQFLYFIELEKELKNANESNHIEKQEISQKNLEEYEEKNKSFDKDCIKEVEPYIIEELYIRFLIGENILTWQDYDSYKNARLNTCLNNCKVILEEFEILKNIEYPITTQTILKYLEQIDSDKIKIMANRFSSMASDPEKKNIDGNKPDPIKSDHLMRYIVAEIISSQWINEYDLQDEKTKKQMINKLFEYLSQAYKLNLNDTNKFLLGENFEKTVASYFNKCCSTTTQYS